MSTLEADAQHKGDAHGHGHAGIHLDAVLERIEHEGDIGQGELVAAPTLVKENWVAGESEKTSMKMDSIHPQVSLIMVVSDRSCCAADGEHEEHRKAAWSELFFDLAYVAAGVKLGNELKESPSNSSHHLNGGG